MSSHLKCLISLNTVSQLFNANIFVIAFPKTPGEIYTAECCSYSYRMSGKTSATLLQEKARLLKFPLTWNQLKAFCF